MLIIELKVLNENGRGDLDCKIVHQDLELYAADTIVEYDGNAIESCSYPDFELMRCKNLNSCLEQAALAITIATKVQLNVRMKYSHDISGTVSNIDIKYNYFDQYAQASIIYTALNGSFEPVKEW